MANGRAGCVFNSGKQNLCLAAGHYGTRTYTDTFTPTHTHRETPNSSKHSTRAEKSENADFILCAHCHTIIRRCVWDNMSQTHTHYSTQTPTTRRLTLSLRRRLTLHKAANATREEKCFLGFSSFSQRHFTTLKFFFLMTLVDCHSNAQWHLPRPLQKVGNA